MGEEEEGSENLDVMEVNMPTKLETLSLELYSLLLEPDHEKRREALETWIASATPVLQSTVESELRSYLGTVLEGRWTDDGWQRGVRKWQRLIDDYPLTLQISLRPLNRRETLQVAYPASSEMHAATVQAYELALSRIEATKAAKLAAEREEALRNAKPASANRENDDDSGDWSEDDASGRAPNDDRSDAMNPNNDAYQAAMDNRSDQMNPNNDAYWSSHGHR